MPVEESKCQGPTTCIQFLGMELDSEALEVRLPEDKLQRLKVLLKEWKGRKAGTKRDLLSLIGTLSHAAKAVRHFLRRLINMSTVVKHPDKYIRLNISACSDMSLQSHGVSMLLRADKQNPQVTVTSDASGS